MRNIVFLFFVLFVAQAAFAGLNTDCPDQYVPDVNNMCIRPNYIQGCEKYKTADQCGICSKDYELSNGICLALGTADLGSNILIGCLVDNGITCSKCANGFRLVGGVCQEGVKYCAEYNSDKNCVRCQNEYSLIFGDCKHNLMLGCKLEQADHTCIECFKPFELKNYQCVIPSCKSYNDYGCYSCECGYFITEDRNCQVMDTGCLKYYRGTCVQCVSHYKLKGGYCAIEGCLAPVDGVCTQCKEDYLLVEGGCKFKNCSEWKDDKCLICDQGYNLEGGKCVQSVGKYICSG